MFKYETIVQPGHEAERVTTAFYRFLELHAAPPCASALVETEILGDRERRTVLLWSEEAVAAFRRYLDSFHIAPPNGLPRRFGL
jgi:hypothetical protein